MAYKTLRDILIDRNLITKEQLEHAQKEADSSGESVESILLKNNVITSEDLAQAFAQDAKVPYIEKISEKMVDPNQISKIPLKFLRQHVVLPITVDDHTTLVTADPRDIQPLDDLSRLIKGPVTHAIATPQTIVDAINKFYPLESSKEMMEELSEDATDFELGAIAEKDILEMAHEAPIVKLVNHILYQAVKEDASDIHIEPYEKELRVRYRIDGVMHQRILPPKRFQGAIVSRIKIMANLNIAEKRLPQDGRILIKIADKPIDLRVSILPTNFGERVVMRILDTSKGLLNLDQIGFSKRDYEIISNAIEQPNGIFLVTGPTGSGKTSTLYAMLKRLNTPDVNIVTVEDPVEYTLSGINQVQVKEKIGLTFAAALRSILRQDPDIILIGEIRDRETAQIATQASLTGHLVFSTLHTNSSAATITRLIDMGIEPFLIASSVICILAQRLVRKLCDLCKQPFKPDADMLHRLGLSAQEADKITFYKAVGCDECLNTGYRGRIAIFEVMPITDTIRQLIMERADASVIRQEALRSGQTLLVTDGIRRISQGLTTVEEVLSAAVAEEEDLELEG